ncbi:MAG: hypothetical protein IPN76_18140 [Saprospiraceae bacterium]|jgi:putative membrane protein|nr:hypothetical protein [Saprospiraceae bacterium]
MYIHRNIHWKIVLRFAWKYLLIFTAWSTVTMAIHVHLHNHGTNLSIPFAPLGTIGVAVAFYIGFKNNQSYDRFWEARTIWGGIVNGSRTWANQVLSYVSNYHKNTNLTDDELKEIHKRLIYRHLAWINALRLLLRKQSSFSPNYLGAVRRYQAGSPERRHWEEEVKPFLSEKDYEDLICVQNMPAQILRRQGDDLKALMEKTQVIEDFRHMELMASLKDFYNEQGRCERIKNTPLPRQYSYFSKVFCWIFILLLPFALISEFHKMGEGYDWLVVPFSVLISWIFMTIELVGDNSEDPFENFMNDVPMTALCRNIEIDLREMLGETELPPRVLPENGILM